MAALKYWIWLCTRTGLRSINRMRLLEHFSSPEAIYYADAEELRLVEGMTPHQAALLQDKSLRETEEILARCSKEGLFVLTIEDTLYPNRLKNIFNPPPVLYGKGRMPLFDDEAAVAMVGTRRCSPYGVRAAEELGYELATQGALVVSGMARGIDAAAHRGALRGGGFVCAVLGSGVDVVYPPENRRLYEDIAAHGVLLSEYPPGTEPEGWHFPARNRIISGLSLAAVVVEAPPKSGALITANTALEQGREVFAVPGPIDSENSRGCNELIREGAGLVSRADDILEEYRTRYPHKLKQIQATLPPMPEKSEEAAPPTEKTAEKKPQKKTAPPVDLLHMQPALTDDQIGIMRLLRMDAPQQMDEVAEAAEIPIRRALSALTVLEIDGLVRQDESHGFVRTVRLAEDEK